MRNLDAYADLQGRYWQELPGSEATGSASGVAQASEPVGGKESELDLAARDHRRGADGLQGRNGLGHERCLLFDDSVID